MEDQHLEENSAGAHALRHLARERQAAGRERRKAVRLENAIRKHALRDCDCADDRECLMWLFRLIPAIPRGK